MLIFFDSGDNHNYISLNKDIEDFTFLYAGSFINKRTQLSTMTETNEHTPEITLAAIV